MRMTDDRMVKVVQDELLKDSREYEQIEEDDDMEYHCIIIMTLAKTVYMCVCVRVCVLARV